MSYIETEIVDSLYRAEILNQHIKPAYTKDIKDLLSSRYNYRQWSDRFDVLAKIITGLAGTASALSLWDETLQQPCTFVSLVFSTTSVVLSGLASMFLKKSRSQTEYLNQTLESLGINAKMPTAPSIDSSNKHNDNQHNPSINAFSVKPNQGTTSGQNGSVILHSLMSPQRHLNSHMRSPSSQLPNDLTEVVLEMNQQPASAPPPSAPRLPTQSPKLKNNSLQPSNLTPIKV